MYYNLDMLEAAGISEPPKTTEELKDAAAKLTEFNDDGSIKVAGFVPWLGYNCCGNTTLGFGHLFGATWLDDQGNPAFASDPAWAEMLTWQHDFIADVYGDGDFQTGSDRLNRFVAGSADEFSAANDFEIGRVAITFDGEWRPAFIKDEAPDLNYDTAPLPVAPGKEDIYGSGVAGGTVIGIPKGSEHEAEAWLLMKYMATDTDTLVYMANFANNVPTTYDSAEVTRPRPSTAVPDVPGCVREPGLGIPPHHADRGRVGHLPRPVRRQVAGGPGIGSTVRPSDGHRTDADRAGPVERLEERDHRRDNGSSAGDGPGAPGPSPHPSGAEPLAA